MLNFGILATSAALNRCILDFSFVPITSHMKNSVIRLSNTNCELAGARNDACLSFFVTTPRLRYNPVAFVSSFTEKLSVDEQ